MMLEERADRIVSFDAHALMGETRVDRVEGQPVAIHWYRSGSKFVAVRYLGGRLLGDIWS